MKRFLLALLFAMVPALATAQLGSPPHTFIEGENLIDDLNTNFLTAYTNALNRTGGTMTGTLTSQALTPASTNTYDLGSSLVKYRDLFLSRNLDVAGAFAITGSISDPDSAVIVGDQFQVTSTTAAQLQVRYDSSNYYEISVSSAGAVTLNAAGASQGFTFSDNVTINGTLTATTIAGATFSATPEISNSAPILNFNETDGGTDAKRSRFIVNAEVFAFQLLNDAQNVINNVWSVTRSGSTVSGMTITPSLSVSGQILADDGSLTAPGISFAGDTNTGFIGGALDGQVVFVVNGDNLWQVTNTASTPLMSIFADLTVSRTVRLTGTAFAGLGTPANGTFTYCSDCTIASPCASGGSGAIAKRLNSVWVCS